MESKCAVLFFDEIDALGQSRSASGLDSNGGLSAGGGTDNSGRRVLAELLIQMSNLSTRSAEKSNFTRNNSSCKETVLNVEEDCQYSCHSKNTNEEKVEKDDTGCETLPIALERSETLSKSEKLETDVEISNQLHASSQVDGKDSFDVARDAKSSLKKHHHLNQMCTPKLIVVAATNRPEDCDPALLRRFAVRVFIGLPSPRDRKRILRRFLKGIDHSLDTTQLKHLADITNGYSGSDLESLAREAVMAPIRDCLREAAILKTRAKRRKRCESKKTSKISRKNNSNDDFVRLPLIYAEEESHTKARDLLLKSFGNLRPVSLDDFERAISFWIGYQEDNLNVNSQSEPSATNQNEKAHYDTSSSSEDDEEDSVQ